MLSELCASGTIRTVAVVNEMIPSVISRGHATLHITVSVGRSVRPSVTFLVADTQLYKRLCPSVSRSVGPSVRRSVGPSVVRP